MLRVSESAITRYGKFLAQGWKADINCWYIENDNVCYELTRMNDKWWMDIPFETIIEFDK